MEDILVATAARPQDIEFDERLGERQQQMPIPNQLARGWFSKILLQEVVDLCPCGIVSGPTIQSDREGQAQTAELAQPMSGEEIQPRSKRLIAG